MYKDKTIIIDIDQVKLFCQCVNDTNIIHQNNEKSVIVPGMLTTSLMFEKPSDYWRLAKMNNRYSNPVYSGIPVSYNYKILTDRSKLKKYQITVSQNNIVCIESEVILVKKESSYIF